MQPTTTGATAKVIDVKTFWRTLGQRAIGSTIVTARGEDGPAGFLGLSASHICADPPLMLVSIDKRTSALAAVLAARHFAVNFLPGDAAEIADMFGGKGALKGAARFETARWPSVRSRSSSAPRASSATIWSSWTATWRWSPPAPDSA